MKHVQGTVIYENPNLKCMHINVVDDTFQNSFAKCQNPLLCCEFAQTGEWVLECPEDYTECEYHIKQSVEDLITVKNFILQKQEKKWIGITIEEWENLLSKLWSSPKDEELYLRWLFKVKGFIIFKDSNEIIDEEKYFNVFHEIGWNAD